jgi:diguanylate cyclase (GGDEF)-like protein
MQPMLSLVPSERSQPDDDAPPAAFGNATLVRRLEETSRQLALTQSLLANKQRECDELARALAHDAHSDALTGLFNRRKFNELCGTEIERSARYGTPLALIMVDLDHFKRVNDEHGHLVGDRTLVEVARVLAGQIRASDALCRWGGEEFMVLAPHLDMDSAVQMADKLRSAVAVADFGEAGPLTCSFGVAALRDRDRTVDLILRADTCLYRAKRTGRNCVAMQTDGDEATTV